MGVSVLAGGSGLNIINAGIGLGNDLEGNVTAQIDGVVNVDIALFPSWVEGAAGKLGTINSAIKFIAHVEGTPAPSIINAGIGIGVNSKLGEIFGPVELFPGIGLDIQVDAPFHNTVLNPGIGIDASTEASINDIVKIYGEIGLGASLDGNAVPLTEINSTIGISSEMSAAGQTDAVIGLGISLDPGISANVLNSRVINTAIGIGADISGESAGATGCGSIKCFDEQTRWS